MVHCVQLPGVCVHRMDTRASCKDCIFKKTINIHNISYPFQSVYFVSNINDVFVVSETLSLCSGIINAMIKGFVYIRNREKLRRLLIALQRNVDNSRYR